MVAEGVAMTDIPRMPDGRAVPSVLTTKEALEFLRMSRSGLDQLRGAGRIRAFGSRNGMRFYREELIRYVEHETTHNAK